MNLLLASMHQKWEIKRRQSIQTELDLHSLHLEVFDIIENIEKSFNPRLKSLRRKGF